MTKIIFSHIALIMANTIYAVNYLFAKDVMPNYIQPSGFILVRVIGAAVIFSLIHALFIKEKIIKKDLWYLIICALFGVVINMLCFFEGLSITSPINASLIMITTPLIVYLISWTLFKEEREYKRFTGVVLGLFGAAILITNGSSQFKIDNFGDVLIFLNAVSYAIYLILIKSMMKKYHPITVLKIIFLVGLIIIFPFGWHELSIVDFSILPIQIFLKVLFVVLFTTCIAYFLNIYAIRMLKSSTVAFYIYLQPLLATVLAICWGKGMLTRPIIIAALFIFIGVYFVVKRNAT